MSKEFSHIVQIFHHPDHEEPTFLGSGFLISASRVLTARHVAEGHQYNLPAKYKQIKLKISTHNNTNIVVAAAKPLPNEDLSILDLSSPFHARVLPLFHGTTADLQSCHGKWYANGYEEKGAEIAQKSQRISPDFPLDRPRTSTPERVQLTPGLPNGFSGGPVVVRRWFKWSCVGMVWLGGNESGHSVMLASPHIKSILDKNSIAVRHRGNNSWLRVVVIVIGLVFASWFGYKKYCLIKKENAEELAAQNSCSVNNNQIVRPLEMIFGISTFHGTDGNSRQFGEDVAARMKATLQSYLDDEGTSKRWQEAHLSIRNITVVPLPHTIDSHRKAREIGLEAGVNIVIWGDVKLFKKGDSVIVPNITEVSCNTLQATVSIGLPHIESTQRLYRMTFPELATNHLEAFIQHMLGLYAYRAEKYDLAAYYFNKLNSASFEQTWQFANIIANTFVETGEYQRGEQIFKRAAQWCSKEDYACMAYLWLGVVRAQHLRNARDDVIQNAVKYALPNAKQLGNHRIQFEILRILCLAYINIQKGAEAIHAAESMITLSAYEKKKEYQEQYVSIASILLAQARGDIKDIQESIKKIIGILPKSEAKAVYHWELGLAYAANFNYKDALSQYQKANEIMKDQEGIRCVKALMDVGVQLHKIGFLDEAIESFNLAHSAAQKLPAVIARRKQASISSDLAAIFASKDNHELAVSYLKDSLSYLETAAKTSDAESKEVALYIYENCVYAYVRVRKIDTALELLSKALSTSFSSRQPYLRGRADLLQRRANLLAELGRSMDAIDSFIEAAEQYRQQGNRLWELAMVEAACWVDDSQKAVAACTTALELVGRGPTDDPSVALGRGRLLTRLGKINEAQTVYQRAMTTIHSTEKATEQKKWRSFVLAGQARLSNGGLLDGCYGLAVVHNAFECSSQLPCLQEGDIILRANKSCLSTIASYQHIVATKFHERIISFNIWRDGKLHYIKTNWPESGVALIPF